MKFNPNDIRKPKEVWGTYITERNPSFKAHTTRGLAISALKYRARYKIVKGVPDYSNLEIPEKYTLWQHNGTEWIEIEFERDYHKDQKGLVFK